ncbi:MULTISPECIES: adenylate/guanylate cyclase domain-containing protein [unclassified Chelatococcus]|uniref:CHASE2 domain-containing protein n=1 Tax=unclassified Chelatococcus TaxID=2638111 RepID=UPI001BCBEAD7|nr:MULTISPECIES: adenylate/guanylate cyclase domain-containing protein [unclassified Chelatococcus]MBS7698663.1 CHASE2 domain-containing protein [Chelatococcus sp. YT9]MBX3554755.1 CHASE2 domain-containing protein [Chelatococcus sp.]
MRRRHVAQLSFALAIGLAISWAAYVVHWHVAGRASVFDRIEAVTLDLRALMTPGKAPPPEVIVVAIDDEAVRQMGAYPLPREKLASLIDAIARRNPKAVAVDLLFVDSSTPAQDKALAEALARVPAVIAAAALFDAAEAKRPFTGSVTAPVPRPRSIMWPVAPLANAAEVGLVNVATDVGGMPRHLPMIYRGRDGVIPSFVLLAAALATSTTPRLEGESLNLGAHSIALDLGQHLTLRFYGPRGTIPTISATKFMSSSPPDVAGRTVVVGTTATGSGDTFPTPFSPVVPGVEVLATAIGNLLAGDGLLRSQAIRWFDAAMSVMLAVAAVILMGTRRPVAGLGLCVLLAAAWIALTLAAFAHGYWLSTTLPLVAMLPVAMAYGALRLWQERRTVRYLVGVEERLMPFQPRPIAARLTQDPAFLAEPIAQDAAVIFVDLAGYTGLSEALGAERTREVLKSFHMLVDEVVDSHGGFVATFMGDGAMILFGFPERHDDDAARALRALDDLREKLGTWVMPTASEARGKPLARLTAHFGPVIVSRLGGHSHQQVTATGDTVNVASRLQEVAKSLNVTTVVTDDIVRAASRSGTIDNFPEVIEVPIRGRNQPVTVRTTAKAPAHP